MNLPLGREPSSSSLLLCPCASLPLLCYLHLHCYLHLTMGFDRNREVTFTASIEAHRHECLLSLDENEAEIKDTLKERSPTCCSLSILTLRSVMRTALDKRLNNRFIY